MCIWIYSSSSASPDFSLLLFLWEKWSLWCVLSTGLQLRTMGWAAFLQNVSAHHFGSGLPKAPWTSQDMIAFAWILLFFPHRQLAMFGYHSFMPITDLTKSDLCLAKDGPSSPAGLLQWSVQETGQIFTNTLFYMGSHHLFLRNL